MYPDEKQPIEFKRNQELREYHKEGIELQNWSRDTGEKCTSDDPHAYREICEDCEGIGFIQFDN